MTLKKQKKKTNLNDHIVENRTRLGSRLNFSESSFNFLQNSVIFCAFYPRWYMTGGSAPHIPRLHCQRRSGLKVLSYLEQCQIPVAILVKEMWRNHLLLEF